MLILVRSIVFNVLFYLNTAVWLVIALPTFFMPYRAILAVAKAWGRSNLVLLRVVAGIDYEIRGREKIPQGPLIVAAKHQSAWETFALLPLFDNPLFIVKRELQWIPIFGWLMIKGRMVPVNRGAGSQALAAMTERARIELADNRQLIIFPEGTRRPAGAEPRYKYRRRASLRRGGRALRSDRAQFRPVLAAPLDPPAAGDGAGGDSRSDPARARQGRILRAVAARPRNGDGAPDRRVAEAKAAGR